MRERDVERNLVRSVRSAGGLALKFISPGMAGVPDRLILLPGGRIAFCEVKAPGQKPRPLQFHRMEQLRRLGFRVYVIDGVVQIGKMLEEIKEDAVVATAPQKSNSVTQAPSLKLDPPGSRACVARLPGRSVEE